MREFRRVRLNGKGDEVVRLDGKGGDIFFDRPNSSFGSEEFEDRASLWGSEERYTKPSNKYDTEPSDFTWKIDSTMEYQTGIKPVPASASMVPAGWPRDRESGVKPVPAQFTWGQTQVPSKIRKREWPFDE